MVAKVAKAAQVATIVKSKSGNNYKVITYWKRRKNHKHFNISGHPNDKALLDFFGGLSTTNMERPMFVRFAADVQVAKLFLGHRIDKNLFHLFGGVTFNKYSAAERITWYWKDRKTIAQMSESQNSQNNLCHLIDKGLFDFLSSPRSDKHRATKT